MHTPQSQSSEGNSQLDITLGVLQGGLSNGVDIAPSNLIGWIKTLQGTPKFATISAELQQLHDSLSHGSITASALAQSLAALGEHTTHAAATATPDAQAKLLELGQALRAAADQLKG
jgi:hypothetical protein